MTTNRIENHNKKLNEILGLSNEADELTIECQNLKCKKRALKQEAKDDLHVMKKQFKKHEVYDKNKIQTLKSIIIDLLEEKHDEYQSQDELYRFNIIKTNVNVIIQLETLSIGHTTFCIVAVIDINKIQQFELNKQL